MVNINELRNAVESLLQNTDYFFVDATEGPNATVDIEIDSKDPVDIDFCIDLNRKLHEQFGEALDDCDLTVGSAGLTSPFKIKAQYEKNIGNQVETLTRDGKKLQGELLQVGPDSFTIAITAKIKKEGIKKPVIEIIPTEIKYDNVKYTKYLLQF